MAAERIERAVKATQQAGWAELGIVEHKGELFLPVKLRRRRADGGLDERPAMLRVPTAQHRVKARVRARKWADEQGLSAQDQDLITELENYWLLSFALRDAKAPHDQMFPDGPSLHTAVEQVSLRELWAKLDFLGDVLDPRYGELSDDEMWKVIERIAARGEPGPLAELDSLSQATCITFMAKAAWSSRTGKSSSPSPGS